MADDLEEKPDEKPATKSELQDDVKWLEERLDKQDLTQQELKTELAALRTQMETLPVTWTKPLMDKLEAMETKMDSLQKKPSQTDSQSNQPASTNQNNQSDEDVDGKKAASTGKKEVRLHRRLI